MIFRALLRQCDLFKGSSAIHRNLRFLVVDQAGVAEGRNQAQWRPGTCESSRITWSADDEAVEFGAGGQLWRLDVRSAQATAIGDAPRSGGFTQFTILSRSPDRRTSRGEGVRRVRSG